MHLHYEVNKNTLVVVDNKIILPRVCANLLNSLFKLPFSEGISSWNVSVIEKVR